MVAPACAGADVRVRSAQREGESRQSAPRPEDGGHHRESDREGERKALDDLTHGDGPRILGRS